VTRTRRQAYGAAAWKSQTGRGDEELSASSVELSASSVELSTLPATGARLGPNSLRELRAFGCPALCGLADPHSAGYPHSGLNLSTKGKPT
ncbi:hypothetical protein, partial [Jatrophihabitans sp.]|uniref:hypothetical protein n=1 Tax=Jatrophihabitans sp. TaxID=1932789 RepID=UPI002EDC7067